MGERKDLDVKVYEWMSQRSLAKTYKATTTVIDNHTSTRHNVQVSNLVVIAQRSTELISRSNINVLRA